MWGLQRDYWASLYIKGLVGVILRHALMRLLYVLGILELMAFPLLGAGTFSMAPDEKPLS